MCKSNGMETEKVNHLTESTFTLSILFGMWLQKKEQRKRLAKADMMQLFLEWTEELKKSYRNED